MKKVRVMSSAALLALMSLGTVTMMSCEKTEDCPIGLEGKDCDVEIRAEMLGTYDAIDKRVSDQLTKTYTPTITANGTVTVVNIQEFGDFYSGVSELVTSNVTKSGDVISFTIPNQKPDNLYEVSGSGTYNVKTKRADLSYGISDGVNINNYTGVWTKR